MKFTVLAIAAFVASVCAVAAPEPVQGQGINVAQPNLVQLERRIIKKGKPPVLHARRCSLVACDEDADCEPDCGTCQRIGPRVPGRKVCSG